MAAIVDVTLFERIRKLDEAFNMMTTELSKAFEEVAPEKGMALVEEAVKAARTKG